MTFNLADLFEAVTDAIPDKPALVSGARRFSFAELDARATRLAHHLRREGVRAGEHIGLYLYNGNEYLEAVLAAFKIRAVPININYRYVEDELRYLCQNADLVALLHQPELAARVDAIAGELPTLRARLAVGDDYEAALAASPAARDFPQRSGDDLYIIYTGGTTGMPRGVMWRHEDVFFAGLQGGNPGGDPVTRPDEVVSLARSGEKALTFLPAAPFIHGAAQWAAFIGLFAGGKVVVAPGPRFDALRVAQLIAEEQVNTLTLVGDAMARPLADALAANPSLDTSSLIVIASAGAILSGSVQEALAASLPNTMILNNFGASETGHQGRATDATARPKFFMSDSTVLDEQLRPAAPGTIGKLARRGRIPLGYYNDPEKTAATFVTVDNERWVVPGDLATVEEDGTITVLGRGAVCINSGGEKVFPEEIEEALKAHPDVLDAVVVGVPDERWGERVAALLQFRDDRRPTWHEVESHCRARVAGYKVPREFHVVDEMVRHPSGKPDYRWAKAEALARRDDWLAHRWLLSDCQPTGAWAEARRLSRAVQELMHLTVSVDAPPDQRDELRQIVAALQEQAARLRALPRRASSAFLDGSDHHTRVPFIDRGPLVGLCNPLAPPMRHSQEGDTAVALVTFGAAYEGGPGLVHGGFVAAAFDQLFGYLGVMRGVPSLTGTLTVRYRRPTPLHTELRMVAKVVRLDGRKSFLEATCHAGDELVCDAEALFVAVGAEWFQALSGAK
jgi:acyl-CoA synthetase (AMP-forming)/AMP-acid ligase II/acyl-coenzyme A thioesterase PaaI-like protein